MILSILIFAVVFLSIPVLRSGYLMAVRDDNLILDPIRGINSFQDFWNVHFNLKKYDIFPLVDLSYLIDLYLESKGFFSFHYSNLFYWIICIFLVYKIFQQLYFGQKYLPIILTSFVSLHPACFMTTSWISGRKHILGFMFFLFCYFFYQKIKGEKSLKMYVLFALSYIGILFSHILYSLFPIAILFSESIVEKRLSKKYFKLLILHIALFFFGGS